MLIPYIYTIGSVLLISLVSIIGILALSANERFFRRVIFFLVSLAVGALFGDAFIHLIPESFAEAREPISVSLLIMGGFFFFFILEKVLHWHHAHENETSWVETEHKEWANRSPKTLGYLILVSDGFHNFIDGLIVGASYLVSIEIGIATTIAIVLHEIPQEISDFGVLLYAGFSKSKALLLNFVSALLAVGGGLLAIVLSGSVDGFVGWMIPVAAGGFIYIAGSDLIPELHKTKDLRRSLLQVAAISIGILAMLLLLQLD